MMFCSNEAHTTAVYVQQVLVLISVFYQNSHPKISQIWVEVLHTS